MILMEPLELDDGSVNREKYLRLHE
jgi:hypothetical protein